MLQIEAYLRYQADMSLQNTSPVPPAQALQVPAKRFKWKRHASHTRALRRIDTRHPPDPTANLAKQCAQWLFPWKVTTFPGVNRGLLEIFRAHPALRTVERWREGSRPLPAWAAKDLADHMQMLVDQALPLIAALRDLERAEAKRIKRIDRGFCVVRAARNRPAPGDPA